MIFIIFYFEINYFWSPDLRAYDWYKDSSSTGGQVLKFTPKKSIYIDADLRGQLHYGPHAQAVC